MSKSHPSPSSNSSASPQIVEQAHPFCANTRRMFAGCTHICLQRCSVHPTDPLSLENTCPNPKATFSAAISESSCPRCASQSDIRAEISRLNDRIGALGAATKQDLVSRREAVTHCTMKSSVLKAELQRTKEELQAVEKMFDGSGGGPGLEVIGLRSDNPEDFAEVFCWFPCEAENLWGWELDV